MASSHNNKSECGAFIACGAACVSFDHEPGEPTSIDKLFAALKRFTHKNSSTNVVYEYQSTVTATPENASPSYV